MIRSRRRVLAALALATVPALLSGCAGLQTLQSAATPTDLYSLTPKSSFDADIPSVSAQIVIEEPTADASVNTDRIAVKPHPLRVQYFPGARWVERAPLAVQRMLIESFENTDKLRSVGRSAVGLRSDYTVMVDLREFQAELAEDDPNAPVTANVQLNLKIIQQPEGLIVGSRSFGHQVSARSDALIEVVEAFDAGLGKAMRSAVEWTLRRVDELERDDDRLMRRRLLGG